MESFKEAELKPEILKALEEIGFETPTPVQTAVLENYNGKNEDIVAIAQTGTGKTAAFSLPIINNIDEDDPNVQALILSPTRELAIQIGNDIDKFTKYLKKTNYTAVYGGAPITNQIKDIRNKKPQIIVGTPGRTIDLINRKKLKLSNLQIIVLDEADEMLSMGFKEDLETILETVPDERTVYLFSATMAKQVRKIAGKFLNNPREITIGSKNESAKNVSHAYYVVSSRNRYEGIKRVLDLNPDIYGIIFCRTRADTKDLAAQLTVDGYNSDALHGDLSQAQRDYVMNKFRKKHIQMLVATDVAARGLDVDSLTHVIHHKLPDDPEVYVHRSGRTGRAGNSGISLAFLQSREVRRIRSLEKMIGKDMQLLKLPSGMDVTKKQLFNYIDKIEGLEMESEEMDAFLPEIIKRLSWLDKDELIKRFVGFEMNTLLEYYKNSRDLNESAKKDKKERTKGNAGFDRYFINIGKTHNATVKDIIHLINDSLERGDVEIGQIELLKGFSFFEVDENYSKKLLEGFKNMKFKNYNINVEPAQAKQGTGGGRGGRDRGRGRGRSTRGESRSRRGENKRFGKSRKKKRY